MIERMTIAQFINKSDLAGGIEKMFECGFIPAQLDYYNKQEAEFADLVSELYVVWNDLKALKDKYYDMVENEGF